MTQPKGPFVRVLMIEQDGGYTAQMLEMDFAARGATPDEALHCLERTILGHVRFNQMHKRSPLAGIKPAPQYFWDKWRALELESSDVPDIPDAYIINATVQSPSYQLHW